VILSNYSGKGYNLSADIWSLGCTVIEMATGKHPWHQYEQTAAMFRLALITDIPEIPESLSEEGKDFLRQCLRREPRSRPTATQLMDHPFARAYGAAVWDFKTQRIGKQGYYLLVVKSSHQSMDYLRAADGMYLGITYLAKTKPCVNRMMNISRGRCKCAVVT
ncbi:Mitogen-activated protein kinase kinase kinase YODA, partial [Dichanthelium oligosanthes]